MHRIAVLLSVSPRMFRDALRTMIQAEFDLDVVDEVLHPIDLLLAVGESGADVVVLTVPASGGTPPICTHLLSEFPELTVIAICPEAGTAVTYRSPIEGEPIGLTCSDVIAAIRTASCSL